MRYAVLTDVHANALALEAVVDSLESRGIDSVVCLGDTVGYGADPGEAIAVIRQLCDKTVLGNHDSAAVSEGLEARFNQWARDAIAWTRTRLTEDEVEFLRGLPMTATHQGALLVHASPLDPGSWRYLIRGRDASAAFAAFEERLCLVGHSHEPVFFECGGTTTRVVPVGKLEMADDKRYIVNAGSVGQPRDGDPRASYAVVEPDAGTVEIVRVPYDTERAGRRITAAGLPAFLGERLSSGC